MKPILHIAYGSESGNAHRLAYQLKLKCIGLSAQFSELNELSLSDLSNFNKEDVLLVVTSTTGSGEAPHNASKFYQSLARNQSTKDKLVVDFNFAVFGIGDVNYEDFCGFSIVIDGLLRRIGAKAISNRVDADVDFENFFEQWSDAVVAYLKQKDEPKKAALKTILQALHLQVDPNAK